nr:type IV pilus secretin PilQ [Rosenbergiella australiborealis]
MSFSVVANTKISINVENTPAAHIFSLLASVKNINLVVDPAIDQSLTLHLVDVEWQDALDIVKYLTNVDVFEQGNILVFRPLPASHRQEESETFSASAKKAKIMQRVFPLRYIEAAVLEKQLMALPLGGLGGRGKLFVDHDQQQIIIWDEEESLQSIAEWILVHDQPQPQIEIMAQMISISQDNLRELGVSWFNEMSGTTDTTTIRHQFTTSLAFSAPSLHVKTAIARIDSQLLFLELTALEQENQLDIIASPHLVTSQGRTASIKQGTEIPYQTVSGKNDNPVISFKEAVLGMEVTPERVGREHIRLRLRLNQDVPGKILQGEGKGPPSIDKQEIMTEVLVANGSTVALGGIFQQQQHQGLATVPGLGRLPVLGTLFQKKTQQHQKRELVIFITPRLLPTENTP